MSVAYYCEGGNLEEEIILNGSERRRDRNTKLLIEFHAFVHKNWKLFHYIIVNLLNFAGFPKVTLLQIS